MSAGRILDAYDNGNGTMLLAWIPFGVATDSYNVYLNGVLNQSVSTRTATVTGLHGASYNGAVITAPGTYTFTVVARHAGVETLAAPSHRLTVQPTSVMLVTPMKRPFPFPNTAPGG